MEQNPPVEATTARRILVVDDESTIADSVAARLRAEGFTVTTAPDGPAAVAAAETFEPDLVVLDVMLPGYDGLEVCRRIQAERSIPVLMLTARTDETDQLIGLGVGADDYLTKPFSLRVLTARVHALLRRVERAGDQRGAVTVVGDLRIDSDQRRVWRGGVEAQLTPLEFDLLARLARRPRAVLARERLFEEVWDWADAAGTRAVDSHIKALRRKLGADLIRTVHGVGYALETR
ncbi:response regulator transcription factor [Nocardia nova]|uniref:response regulator transcription factor n=1 Tax=Nocardia nova TaxID=37330 RepID=UPI000CE9E46F|nr:response regulator transcription factor [Nocardia nova]PPJ00384.1 DNA-binding response regulator [Nocardia nova]